MSVRSVGTSPACSHLRNMRSKLRKASSLSRLSCLGARPSGQAVPFLNPRAATLISSGVSNLGRSKSPHCSNPLVPLASSTPDSPGAGAALASSLPAEGLFQIFCHRSCCCLKRWCGSELACPGLSGSSANCGGHYLGHFAPSVRQACSILMGSIHESLPLWLRCLSVAGA